MQCSLSRILFCSFSYCTLFHNSTRQSCEEKCKNCEDPCRISIAVLLPSNQQVSLHIMFHHRSNQMTIHISMIRTTSLRIRTLSLHNINVPDVLVHPMCLCCVPVTVCGLMIFAPDCAPPQKPTCSAGFLGRNIVSTYDRHTQTPLSSNNKFLLTQMRPYKPDDKYEQDQCRVSCHC